MKYIRFLWVIAIILFIIPFLGFPQSFKDALIFICAFLIGGLAWFRNAKLKQKVLLRKKMIEEEQSSIDETSK